MSKTETGWLVEFKGRSPQWWALAGSKGEGGYMTTDSTEALRFARREDAEAYIEDAGWTEAVATEHGWS